MPKKHHWKILLVEDDDAGRETLGEWLERRGYDPILVADGKEAIRHIHDGVAVVITDLKMPRTGGLQLLRYVTKHAPHAAVIIITGHGTVDSAVTALKEGAFDFLTKPLNLEELQHRIEMALERRTMTAEIAELHAQLQERHCLENMIGASSSMRMLFEKIRLVADTRSTVLITGESGTGKELVARSLHHLSSRSKEPFVPINCAAIPETLVESELFGHEQGAFTGASERRSGYFEAAEGGTLFIDEVGDLQLGSQSKLLRAIESRKIMRVGSTKEVDIDVRLVAATNRNLKELIEQRLFREDLYFRLKVVELDLPPLRERREDIPLLVRHFVEQITQDNNRSINEISPEALRALTAYDWPGNVRELRNTLEGAIVLSMDDQLGLDDLPEHIRGATENQAVIRPGMTMREIEKEAIRRTLEQTEGRRGEAAGLLEISVRTLQRKIKEYDL